MRAGVTGQRAALTLALFLLGGVALAHGVAPGDRGFVQGTIGAHPAAFIYLGAKHMVTGYDHLLYLAGVIFYLRTLRDVVALVSLFALGHSITLLVGVLAGLHVNAFVIDAVIGLSVCYKAVENLGARGLPNPRIAVFGFGLAHGLGLATKLQDLNLSRDGLIANLVAFNIGVEVGQVLALAVLFGLLQVLRGRAGMPAISQTANVVLFAAGLGLFGLHMTGYFVTS